MLPSAVGRGAGLDAYTGGGARIGTRSFRETRYALVVGAFADWGLSENLFLRGGIDRANADWTVAAGLGYVFVETSPLVRPYAALGIAKEVQREPLHPDVRFGLALGGFGTSSLLLEARWLQTAGDMTAGWTTPL